MKPMGFRGISRYELHADIMPKKTIRKYKRGEKQKVKKHVQDFIKSKNNKRAASKDA